MFALFGTLVLAGLAALFGIRDVQEDVERRTAAALREIGVTEFDVKASGFDVSVSGTTDSEEIAATANALGEQLDNIGTYSGTIQYIPPREAIDVVIIADPLVISWSPVRAFATGTLSTQANRDAVAAEIERVFPLVGTEGLGVTEGAPTESGWLSAVLSLMADMAAAAPEGEIVVNPSANIIQVSAEMETRQEQRNLRNDIEDWLLRSGVGFDFSSGITAKDVPRVTREQVEETQASLDEIIEGKVVEFEFGSAVLTSEGIALLDEILDGLQKHPLVGVEIAGHTDDVGTVEDNQLLSEERANAVFDYFVANGEDPIRFVVIGYGETQPVASNDTSDGRARNRRIEFIALLDEEEEE
jgi:OOP family OmpA-OmpF porin